MNDHLYPLTVPVHRIGSFILITDYQSETGRQYAEESILYTLYAAFLYIFQCREDELRAIVSEMGPAGQVGKEGVRCDVAKRCLFLWFPLSRSHWTGLH